MTLRAREAPPVDRVMEAVGQERDSSVSRGSRTAGWMISPGRGRIHQGSVLVMPREGAGPISRDRRRRDLRLLDTAGRREVAETKA